MVTELGYERPIRADRISESGRITRQVIQHIVEDDLVIADLTDSNPNVYYELALRHAVKKPFVQILTGEDPLPFDVADQRTIMVDHKDLDSAAAARDELARQIQALLSDPSQIDTPLSFALDIATLKGSEDPGDRTQGEMLEMLQEMRAMQHSTYAAVRRPYSRADITALRRFAEVVTKDGSVTDEDVERLVTNATSAEHDQWVAELKRAMSPFLPAKRTPTATGSAVSRSATPVDPWATPPSTSGGFADAPPF